MTVHGGMAGFMLADAAHVLPLGGLDPVTAGPLADAGLTPMHAIESVRPLLTPGATVVVVVGVGGLGHMGVQILRATSAVRIVAVDRSPGALELASRLGAEITTSSDDGTADRILDLTDGHGAEVVLDFVGAQPTVELAARSVAAGGAIRFVGLGGGQLTHGAEAATELLPWGVDLAKHYGGTQAEQLDVLALADAGLLEVETTTYPIDSYAEAFDALRTGRQSGRAVLVP